MRSLRRLLATCLALAAVVAGPAMGERRALAAPVTEGQRLRAARQHYEQAVSHFNLDEFEAALAEFREAYRIKPDPSFLFNIAQCYRKLGLRDAAIDFFHKYVRASPDANNRAEAERWIAELKARGDDPAAAATADGAPPAASSATTTAAPAAAPVDAPTSAPLALSPPPASTTPASTPLALGISASASATPAETTPVYRRWWFWTALGAVAAGAAVIAFSLGSTPASPYAGNIAPGTIHVPTN